MGSDPATGTSQTDASGRAHGALVEQLSAAARAGEDVVALLRSEREHLAGCEACREGIARLAGAALPDRGLMALLEQCEALGLLPEPPAYPAFDLSEVARPAGPWLDIEAGTPARRLSQEIALQITVHGRRLQAVFEGLGSAWSGLVSPALAPALAPVRSGRRHPAGQTVTLPDAEHNLAVAVTAEAGGAARVHVAIAVREIEPFRPLEGVRVSLRSATGSETTRTRGGMASFTGLEPGQYEVEIRPASGPHAGRTWTLPFAVARTGEAGS